MGREEATLRENGKKHVDVQQQNKEKSQNKVKQEEECVVPSDMIIKKARRKREKREKRKGGSVEKKEKGRKNRETKERDEKQEKERRVHEA